MKSVFFERLEVRGVAIEKLQLQLEISVRFLQICLNLFASRGFINIHNGKVELTEGARYYLLRSSRFYLGSVFETSRPNYPFAQSLLRAARSDFQAEQKHEDQMNLGW